MAEAFFRLAEINLDNLAYSANLPPEVVGLNGQSNQSSRALAPAAGCIQDPGYRYPG